MAAVALTLRLHAADLAALDALVAELAGSPVAVAAGGRWGRPAVLRLAVDAGLKALRGGAPPPATPDPFGPADAPADDHAGPVATFA